MLNYVRSILENPDQKPMDDMLALLQNAPSQGLELWSSIQQQAHYNQGFIEGGTAILKKTSDEGGFGFGHPVGLFDAETHKLLAISPTQGGVPTNDKFHDILKGDFPDGIEDNKKGQDNIIKDLFKGHVYMKDYMAYTASGKYYLTKLQHSGLRNIKIPGPIDLSAKASTSTTTSPNSTPTKPKLLTGNARDHHMAELGLD